MSQFGLKPGEPLYEVTIIANSYTHSFWLKHLNELPAWVQERVAVMQAMREEDSYVRVPGVGWIDYPYESDVLIQGRKNRNVGKYIIYRVRLNIPGYERR